MADNLQRAKQILAQAEEQHRDGLSLPDFKRIAQTLALRVADLEGHMASLQVENEALRNGIHQVTDKRQKNDLDHVFRNRGD